MPDSDEVSIMIGHEEHEVAVFSADKMGMPYNVGDIMDVYHRLKPKFVLYIDAIMRKILQPLNIELYLKVILFSLVIEFNLPHTASNHS